jgi:hypothetical protein
MLRPNHENLPGPRGTVERADPLQKFAPLDGDSFNIVGGTAANIRAFGGSE